ncbi:MAG: homoprotocatechuate degradation operon regulator HpaR [Pusillimonas sp.]
MQTKPTFRHRNLPHLFLSARETLMQRFRPILNEAGLTEQQWRVLRTLYDTSDIDAATLADRAQVLSPSLTRILRLLQDANLIERGPDPEDLRRQVIRLSSKGQRMVARIGPRVEAVYQSLEAAIGPKLLASLYRNIDTMIAKIEQTGR